MSTPLRSPLTGLAIYNPDLLRKEDLIVQFVARQSLLDLLVDDIRRRVRKSWLQRGASPAELGWTDSIFDADVLTAKLRSDVESAVRGGRLNYEQSGRLLRFYEEGLGGYTYLEEHPTR